MSSGELSAEWQAEVNRLNYVILDGRRERDELKAQLAESERKRDIAYSALATDEAEIKRLAGLCDQLSFELEQERASAEQLRQAAETNHAAAQHNCKMAEKWERQAQELQAQLDAMRLERDGWKAGAEAGQQQATQLRKQVEALEASLEQVQGANKTLLQQLADADAQIRQFERINDTRDELQHQNKQLQAQLEAVRETAENNYMKWQQEAVKCKAIQGQGSELQAQLEAAAVTPAICLQPADQIPGLPDGSMTDFGRVGGYTAEDLAFHESRTARQPDLPCHCGTAERLEAVRRLIGEIRGWYACIEYFDEIKWAEAWEQVGALLGHLQREVD